MTDPTRHADARPALESLIRSIPGFKGYLEREYRRESDQLARRWLADELRKCKANLDHWQRGLLDAGQIDVLPAGERLRSRLDGLESRVKGAMQGYSGFFDFVQIDESVLEQVYQLDRGLVDEAQALARATESVAGDAGTRQDKLRALEERLAELIRHFDQRGELLAGLS